MAIGYQRQSSANIVDGNIIYASFLNAEFNKLESAFDNINGHNHDGTTAGGAPVPILQTTGTLTVARGGSGATTASDARTNLGVIIGSDVQAWDDDLDDLAALTHGDGRIIVSDGTNWVTESDATARASLGLGSIATQNASNISITGGSVTGITDISVADGGTGASTAAGARASLDVYSKADTNTIANTIADQAESLVYDLSGVTQPTTARTNLGLGSAATQADTRYNHRANNLSDVPNKSQARANLGVAGPEAAYPVGSIYLNASNATNPATLLGFGTWSKIAAGRVLLGVGGAYSQGDTGGAATHTLTASQMPAHTHGDGTLATTSDTHNHYFSDTTSTDTHSHNVQTYYDLAGQVGPAAGARGGRSSGTGTFNTSGDSHNHSVAGNTNSDTHSHNVTGNTASAGGGAAHNNMQPYLAVHIWQRTA